MHARSRCKLYHVLLAKPSLLQADLPYRAQASEFEVNSIATRSLDKIQLYFWGAQLAFTQICTLLCSEECENDTISQPLWNEPLLCHCKSGSSAKPQLQRVLKHTIMLHNAMTQQPL